LGFLGKCFSKQTRYTTRQKENSLSTIITIAEKNRAQKRLDDKVYKFYLIYVPLCIVRLVGLH